MKRYLISLAAALCAAACLTPSQMALAQPSALKPMQDAQRKAEQKAREAKKENEQTDAQEKSHKQESAKPASSP